MTYKRKIYCNFLEDKEYLNEYSYIVISFIYYSYLPIRVEYSLIIVRKNYLKILIY